MLPHLIKTFVLIFTSIIGVSYTDNSKSFCNFNESFLMGTNTAVQDPTFGDCRFENTLCNYTQGYKDDNANDWIVLNGNAVCPGKSGDQSFSVLLSPLLTITQNTSIMFNYSQQLPGRLSVFLVSAANETTQVMPCKDSESGQLHDIFHVNESIAKIAFVAQMSNAGRYVTLSYVKVQAGPNTVLPNNVTSMATSLPYSQPTTTLSTQAEPTDNPEAAEDKGGQSAAIVAGVIVPVIVVVAGVVVGVFIWRHRRQRLHGNPKESLARQDERNTPSCIPGTGSSNKPSPNGPEHSGSAKNKSVHGVLDSSRSHYDIPRRPPARASPSANTSSVNSSKNLVNAKSKSGHDALNTGNNHYDIPRNGQPATCHTAANTESRPPPARASPSAGDDDDSNYNILEEYSTAAAPQAAGGLYSYARDIGRDSSQSNNPEADYNRIGSAEASTREQGEASYDVVEDDYSHVASTDAVAGVRSQAAASRPTGWNDHPGQISTAIEGDSGCDQHTSLACEDGYSVLSAGIKQIQAFDDQRSEGAEKAYGRLASNVHGDYDRIRRKDRDDVLGNDYDHVGGHTEGDYDEMGLTDKEKIIGNDYDHLV